MSLSKALKFKPRPTVSPSIDARFIKISPANNSYTAATGQIIEIEFPCGQGSGYFFVPNMSYFYMQIQNQSTLTGPGAACLVNIEHTVSSLFSRIEVLHNGVPLNDCLDYGALVALKIDQSMTNAEAISTFGCAGYATDRSTGYVLAAGATVGFTFQLLDAIFGTLAERNVHVGVLRGNLIIRLTMNNPTYSVRGANANDIAGYTVKNIAYYARMLILDSPTMAALDYELSEKNDESEAVSGAVYRWHGTAYKSYTQSMAVNSANGNIKFNCRYRSLKAIYGIIRKIAEFAIDQRSNSGRSANRMSEYWFEIGGVQYPPSHVYVDYTYLAADAMTHVQMANHQLGGVNGSTYDNAAYASGNAFNFAIELDRLDHVSDYLRTGLDTTNQDVLFQFNANTGGLALQTACYFTLFPYYDVMYEIADGMLIASY